MKVGITTFGGDGGKSGISQYIIQLLREFARQPDGCTFEVIGYGSERDIFLPQSNGIAYLPFGDHLRSPLRNLLWHQWSLSRCCRERRFDVLFLTAGNRRLPAFSPCPTVGTVHDFSSIHVPGKYDRARMFYITRILPMLVRRLTHVLTVSESSKRDIVEYAGVPEERVTVTPLAANPAVYAPRDRQEALALLSAKYPLRPPFILYTSRIEHPGKNHARLIGAFAQLKRMEKIPHQLVLAGNDWDRADQVHRAAEESGVAGNILFTGFVPAQDLPLLCQAADIFVFPSLYEGFGLPILEAMACGTPVACSSVSSMPEVAGDAAILFDPYQEDSIAGAIRSMITESDISRRLSMRGLERSKEFSWSKTASRTLEVLRSVARGESLV
jgi:glycosyltransferase involved in cell wall biosynthesis